MSTYEWSRGFIFYSHGWLGRGYDFNLFPFEDISNGYSKKQKIEIITTYQKIERWVGTAYSELIFSQLMSWSVRKNLFEILVVSILKIVKLYKKVMNKFSMIILINESFKVNPWLFNRFNERLLRVAIGFWSIWLDSFNETSSSFC